MPAFWLAWILVVVGIIGLVWSADRFVAGSAVLARNLGVSKLVIGLTVVSIGTSAPEILVSISAVLTGQGELGVGNALGSNIANMGLVLAATALLSPIPVRPHLRRQEVPVLLAVTALAGLLLEDGALRPWEGLLLLLLILPLMYGLYRVKSRHPGTEEEETVPDLGQTAALLWFLLGLVVLVVSAKVLVNGAESIALQLGVSPLLVGLTVIALGTSLPELAASLASALKGHHEIALGNVIGSNLFNLLAVMAIPGLAETVMEPAVFHRDYLSMAGLTLVLCGILVAKRRQRLGRWTGGVLLLGYVVYLILLFRTGAALNV